MKIQWAQHIQNHIQQLGIQQQLIILSVKILMGIRVDVKKFSLILFLGIKNYSNKFISSVVEKISISDCFFNALSSDQIGIFFRKDSK